VRTKKSQGPDFCNRPSNFQYVSPPSPWEEGWGRAGLPNRQTTGVLQLALDLRRMLQTSFVYIILFGS
jgi:hypothetical protein